MSGTVLVTIDLLYTFMPLWAVTGDVPAATLGALLSLRALASVATRFGLGRLVARFGRRHLLAASLTAGIGALVALPFVGAGGAVPVMIALGLALGMPQPLTMAWTVAVAPPNAHGAALALRLTANRIAQVSIPLSVGSLAGSFGLAAVFTANAAVLAAGLAIVATSRSFGR